MKSLKKHLAMLTVMTTLFSAGCAGNQNSDIEDLESTLNAISESSSTESAVSADPILQNADGSAFSPELTKTDLNTKWDDSAVTLIFDGGTVTPSSTDGLTVENGTVTITKGGTYMLSGTLDNGRVVVDLTDKTEKVHLILNGVMLHSKTGSPLTVLNADKAVITLAPDTENKLSDGADYTDFNENDDTQIPAACIASKNDLTINGSGKLTVESNYNNGIHCKDDLKIVSGVITVTAKNHGIRGNDSVLLHDGTLEVTSGGDGIKTSTADTDGKGVIYMEGGSVSITSAQDGMDAATDLTVTGGSLAVQSGGGTQNAEQHQGGFGGGGNFGGRGGRRSQDMDAVSGATVQATANTDTTADTSVSTKGMKAAGILTVTGGTVAVNSADDSVHSDNIVQIGGNAAMTLAAGDDGIHADTALSIAGDANVTVSQSYEGLESSRIVIAGGSTHIKASDDGINAAGSTGESTGTQKGGWGFNRSSTGILEISGGYLYVNADGDGLDSNGDITLTGGTVIVCGPTNDGNGPLDCGDNQNKITVTGGTLMAVGSTGMMDVPESNYIAATNTNAAAGTLIVVTDADGKVLGALRTPKQAAGVIFSTDGMSDGYYVYTGGTYNGSFNDDDFATGGSYEQGTLLTSGSGGGGMGGFGGFGGRGGKDKPGGFGGNMNPPTGDESMPEPPNGFDGMPEFPGGGFPGGIPEDFPGGFGSIPGGMENSQTES